MREMSIFLLLLFVIRHTWEMRGAVHIGRHEIGVIFCMGTTTNKETDESWGIFIIWKINSGLVWAAGQYCEKKVWGQLWATFEAVFLCFHGQKINLKCFWKYCSIRTKKLHRVKVKKLKKNLGSIFYRGKTRFFRAKNFNVSTTTLWSVLCWHLLWVILESR